MASLICQGELFYAQFYDPTRRPARKRVALKTRARRDAERALRRMEGAAAAGRFDPWTQRWDPPAGRGTDPTPPPRPEPATELRTLGEAVDAYLASVAHLRRDTLRTYRSVLRLLERHAGRALPLSALGAAHVEAWLQDADVSDVTRRKYAHHAAYLTRYLTRLGLLNGDPTRGVRLRRVPETGPKAMTPAMVAAFVLTARTWRAKAPSLGLRPYDYGWLGDLVEANVELGLRRGELLALRPEHVDLERGVLRVVNSTDFTTKSGKERALPLSTMAWRVLTVRLEGARERVFEAPSGVLTRDSLSHAFLRVRRRAGLPGWVSLHSTRHTALTRLAERGVPVEVIRQFAGHSSITVTERYCRMRPDLVADHVRRAFG